MKNFVLCFIKVVGVALSFLIFTFPVHAKGGTTVFFEWDASSKSGVGYKIYYGKVSRFDNSIDHEKIYQDVVNKYCSDVPEYDPPKPEVLENCKKSVTEYCKDPQDKLCDFDFFSYDQVVDVKSALGWEYFTIDKGVIYFTISMYDEDMLEGIFANEIKVDFNRMPPEGVVNFRATVKDNVSYKVVIEKEEKIE